MNTHYLNRVRDERLTTVRNLLEDLWILLDKVALQAEDVMWVDDFTTAHEGLCELADAYDPEASRIFRERLENNYDVPAPPTITKI